MEEARSSFCGYFASSGKCHETSYIKKNLLKLSHIDNNFCQPLLFLHFLKQWSLATFQCGLIILPRSSPLLHTWRTPLGGLPHPSGRYAVCILTSGIQLVLESVLFNFLAAATIFQLLILHLPSKKSTPGVSWLQILLQDLFLIVLLLIWMSWPDSNASNYILSNFPCHFHCRCYLSYYL